MIIEPIDAAFEAEVARLAGPRQEGESVEDHLKRIHRIRLGLHVRRRATARDCRVSRAHCGTGRRRTPLEPLPRSRVAARPRGSDRGHPMTRRPHPLRRHPLPELQPGRRGVRMTTPWWACKTCGQELYDSQGVYAHRVNTGHNGAALVTTHIGAGEGSTDEGRAAARAIYEQARADARHDTGVNDE